MPCSPPPTQKHTAGCQCSAYESRINNNAISSRRKTHVGRTVGWSGSEIKTKSLNGSANGAAILVLFWSKITEWMLFNWSAPKNTLPSAAAACIACNRLIPRSKPLCRIRIQISNKYTCVYDWKCRNCLEKWKAFNRASQRRFDIFASLLNLCWQLFAVFI